MLRNYWKIAIRNLVRNRFSSVINIGGLAIGMSVALLIGLWLYDELSFDKNIPDHDRIAAVLQNQNLSGGIETWWGQAKQLAPALRKDYGDRFKYVVTMAGPTQRPVSYGDKNLKPSGAFTDPEIADMLSLEMLRGNRNALQDPSSILLSASMAKSLFGTADPLGKIVKLNHTQPLKVAGVYYDLPQNSSFAEMKWIVAFKYLESTDSSIARVGWGNSWFRTYVEVNDKKDLAAASLAIKDVKYQYSEGDRRFKPVLFLHPLNDWHLRSEFRNGVVTGGRIQYVRLFSLIGLFVLLLACINFMNLSTARSEKRAKEVGIRKALGSLRGQLIRQFFSESLLVALISFVLAIFIAEALLPFFSEVSGKKMSIPWGQPLFWLIGFGFVLVTGLLAGSYPALYLSSFRPVKVLKGVFRAGRLASIPRKALVVVQFSVSIILIIGTISVYHQIEYVKDRPVGYTRDGLLMVPLQSQNIRQHFDAFSRELKETGFVGEVAASESDPTNTWTNNMGFKWRGKDPSLQESFTTNGVSPEFGAVTGWKIREGRDFSRTFATDSTAMIINETAVKYMGLTHPIGEGITWGDNGLYTIIGVVKDMIMQTPYEPVRPMIFFLRSTRRNTVNIRLKPQASVSRALAAIQAVYKKYDPDNTFEYRFADQEYARKFGDDERIGKLAGFFTVLAIFISCLGLLGLSAFVAEQRTKEIGLRKVLGASVFHLWNLLSREFIALVGLALLIGGPVAAWIMNGWLGNYQYHAGLSWWIFASAALGAVGLTLLTVSFQTIRAALANPVKSLRAE
jgi:ABC-type antimicrobial peptide transport system permease subunit